MQTFEMVEPWNHKPLQYVKHWDYKGWNIKGLKTIEICTICGDSPCSAINPDEITWIESNKGKHPKLVHNHYIYHYQKPSKKKGSTETFWTCERASAKGSLQCRARGAHSGPPHSIGGTFRITSKDGHNHIENGSKAESEKVSLYKDVTF